MTASSTQGNQGAYYQTAKALLNDTYMQPISDELRNRIEDLEYSNGDLIYYDSSARLFLDRIKYNVGPDPVKYSLNKWMGRIGYAAFVVSQFTLTQAMHIGQFALMKGMNVSAGVCSTIYSQRWNLFNAARSGVHNVVSWGIATMGGFNVVTGAATFALYEKRGVMAASAAYCACVALRALYCKSMLFLERNGTSDGQSSVKVLYADKRIVVVEQIIQNPLVSARLPLQVRIVDALCQQCFAMFAVLGERLKVKACNTLAVCEEQVSDIGKRAFSAAGRKANVILPMVRHCVAEGFGTMKSAIMSFSRGCICYIKVPAFIQYFGYQSLGFVAGVGSFLKVKVHGMFITFRAGVAEAGRKVFKASEVWISNADSKLRRLVFGAKENIRSLGIGIVKIFGSIKLLSRSLGAAFLLKLQGLGTGAKESMMALGNRIVKIFGWMKSSSFSFGFAFFVKLQSFGTSVKEGARFIGTQIINIWGRMRSLSFSLGSGFFVKLRNLGDKLQKNVLGLRDGVFRCLGWIRSSSVSLGAVFILKCSQFGDRAAESFNWIKSLSFSLISKVMPGSRKESVLDDDEEFFDETIEGDGSDAEAANSVVGSDDEPEEGDGLAEAFSADSSLPSVTLDPGTEKEKPAGSEFLNESAPAAASDLVRSSSVEHKDVPVDLKNPEDSADAALAAEAPVQDLPAEVVMTAEGLRTSVGNFNVVAKPETQAGGASRVTFLDPEFAGKVQQIGSEYAGRAQELQEEAEKLEKAEAARRAQQAERQKAQSTFSYFSPSTWRMGSRAGSPYVQQCTSSVAARPPQVNIQGSLNLVGDYDGSGKSLQ